jgi:hypothetical protein
MWDFQIALGETIKAKYESEYVKIIEIDRFPVANMKNFWLDRKKYREAQGLWTEVAKRKAILTRYGKKI